MDVVSISIDPFGKESSPIMPNGNAARYVFKVKQLSHMKGHDLRAIGLNAAGFVYVAVPSESRAMASNPAPVRDLICLRHL